MAHLPRGQDQMGVANTTWQQETSSVPYLPRRRCRCTVSLSAP